MRMNETFRLSDHSEGFKQFSNSQSFEKWPDETALGTGYQSKTHIGTG